MAGLPAGFDPIGASFRRLIFCIFEGDSGRGFGADEITPIDYARPANQPELSTGCYALRSSSRMRARDGFTRRPSVGPVPVAFVTSSGTDYFRVARHPGTIPKHMVIGCAQQPSPA